MADNKYTKQTRSDMKAINVYKPEYEPTIALLGQMYLDRDRALKEFKKEGSRYTIEKPTANGPVTVKNPLYAVIQELNSSIVQTNRELGLTPKGLKALRARDTVEQPTSLLVSLLVGDDDDPVEPEAVS